MLQNKQELRNLNSFLRFPLIFYCLLDIDKKINHQVQTRLIGCVKRDN